MSRKTKERRLTGGQEIGKFLGVVPARISKWRKAHDDIPIVLNAEGKLEASASVLRIWALRNGKVEPRNAKELRIARGGDDLEAPSADPELGSPGNPAAGDRGGDDLDGTGLTKFLDPERFADRRAPTGAIEDELVAAREMRHLLERIVHSWKLEEIADVKEAKTFRDFAAEAVRTIAAIGRLEEALVRQEIRNGRLLDEASVQALTVGIAAAVVAQFHGLSRTIFDLFAAELRLATDDLELDITFDSDRVLKLLDNVFDGARVEVSKMAPASVAEARRSQTDRLGVELELELQEDDEE